MGTFVFFTIYMFYVRIAIIYTFLKYMIVYLNWTEDLYYYARPWPLRSLNEICNLSIQ